jgi:hypothetical protein
MTTSRIPLTTAAIIAGALAVQGLVLGLWSTGLGVVGFGVVITQLLTVNLVWSSLVGLLHYAAFGIGIYLALRFFAPIGASDSWRQTITRAIIATISGAVVALAFSALVSLIAAVTIGAYPFGYALDAAVNGYQVQYGIQNAIAGSLTPLIGWLPLTVLGCVFLKLWLAAHPSPIDAPAPAEATDRTSASA